MDNDFRKNSVISNNLGYFLQKKKEKTSWNFRKNWDKYVYTIGILTISFNYGLISSLFAPAMVDFKYMFHTSMNNISYVNTFKSLGYLIGSLFGFLYIYINRQMTLIIAVIMMGIFVAIQPFCSAIWQMWLCCVVAQMGGGAFDGGSSTWLIEMWKLNSAPLLQLSKATLGFGQVLAPMLDRPFIYGLIVPEDSYINQTIHNSTGIGNMTRDDVIEDYNNDIDRRSKLIWPFMIGGGLALIVPVILLFMFFIKRYKEPIISTDIDQSRGSKPRVGRKSRASVWSQYSSNPSLTLSMKDMKRKEKIEENAPKLRYLFIALVSISLSTYGGMEMLHIFYCSTYYQYGIKMSAQTSADVLSVMSATLTIGKVISCFISIKVKARYMMIGHLVLLAISMAVLYFGRNKEIMIWIGNGLIGFGFSAIWPAYFSFAEEFVTVTNNISTIMSFMSTICQLISPFICGPLIETDPDIFLILELTYFALTVITFAILLVIANRLNKVAKAVDYYVNNPVIDCK